MKDKRKWNSIILGREAQKVEKFIQTNLSRDELVQALEQLRPSENLG